MSKFLPYYSSLNYKMKKYMKDVKYQYVLDEIQVEANKIIRQQDLNLISKLEAQLKIEELKNILKKNKELKKTSLKSTNAAEIVKEDKANIYSPPTTADYENMINKEPKQNLKMTKDSFISENTIKELEDKLKPDFVKIIQENNKAKVLQELISNKIKKDQINKFIDSILTNTINELGAENVVNNIKNRNILKESENVLNSIINKIEKENLKINTINDLYKIESEIETKISPTSIQSSMVANPENIEIENILNTNNFQQAKRRYLTILKNNNLLDKIEWNVMKFNTVDELNKASEKLYNNGYNIDIEEINKTYKKKVKKNRRNKIR